MELQSHFGGGHPLLNGWHHRVIAYGGGVVDLALEGWYAPCGVPGHSRKEPELSCSPRSPPACFWTSDLLFCSFWV